MTTPAVPAHAAGHLTLGNLLGALRPMATRQDDAFYGVADLHAMTLAHDPAVLRAGHRELDAAARRRARPGHAVRQSRVPTHRRSPTCSSARPPPASSAGWCSSRRRAAESSTRVSLFTYPV